MLGFGALGDFPLADSGEQRAATWLSLPAVDVVAALPSIVSMSGRLLGLPGIAIALNAPAAAVLGGRHFGLPAAEINFAAPVSAVYGGRYIGLPALDVAVGYAPAGLHAGKNIDLTAPDILLDAPSMVVSPGKLFGLPAFGVVLAAPALASTAGRSIGLLPFTAAFSYGPPRIETGRIFNLSNSFSLINDAGALANGALGEFALGEGGPVAQTFSRPVALRFAPFAAGLHAGRNLDLTATDVIFGAPIPEVAARHRKLRVQAIAS